MTLRLTIILAWLLVVSGCASVNFDYPKSESFALPATSDTGLARQFSEVVAANADKSGFYPVYDGTDSLALRLLMADRAEISIDAQYFLIHGDLVGNVFISALIKAANRGVRVRLLIDDIQTKGYDAGLATLDTHANIQVRVFNPFAHRSSRALDAPSLSRVTRRMHNKSFTVDNQITMIGGRNIADEYFDARADEQFSDLDVLAIGPVVPEVSEMFDAYWNDRASLPILALAKAPDDAQERFALLDEKVSRSLQEIPASQYADAVKSSVFEYLQSDESAFNWATYDLVYDAPAKSQSNLSGEAGSIVTQMNESIGDIQRELFVVTPYFVLSHDDIEWFRGLRDRNVEVTVLTNSLASNNHSVSHSGYTPARKSLLKMGVKLYEVRANSSLPATENIDLETGKTTLHAKTFVVDQQSIFIGSFNWNQRSVNRDTELGVIINSPKLANGLVDRVTTALPSRSFEVFLSETGKLRWKGHEDGQEIILTKEPQSSFWRRFSAGFFRIFPIKSQL